jgi:hypothetical protein
MGRKIEQSERPLDTDQIRRDIESSSSKSDPWPRRFRCLAEAIARVSESAKVETRVSCEECDNFLDIYVGEELDEVDVQQAYPAVEAHLRRCPRCRGAHDLLYDTLLKERQGQLAMLPQMPTPRLSFLPPKRVEPPWTVEPLTDQLGRPVGLSLTLTASYLQSLLSPARLTLARSLPAPQGESLLLLSDIVQIGAVNVAVSVEAFKDEEQPDRFHLQAIIASQKPPPTGLYAVLVWAGGEMSAPVNASGEVLFTDVPLMDIINLETGEAAGDLMIRFETRQGAGGTDSDAS